MGILLSERFPVRGRRFSRYVDLRIYVVPKVGGWGGAYMYVPPQRVWFGAILVWNRERFSRELRERVNVKKKNIAWSQVSVYRFNSKWKNEIEICENVFQEFFCLRSNPSNDNIISA